MSSPEEQKPEIGSQQFEVEQKPNFHDQKTAFSDPKPFHDYGNGATLPVACSTMSQQPPHYGLYTNPGVGGQFGTYPYMSQFPNGTIPGAYGTSQSASFLYQPSSSSPESKLTGAWAPNMRFI